MLTLIFEKLVGEGFQRGLLAVFYLFTLGYKLTLNQ